MKYASLIPVILLTAAPQFAGATELDHRFINPAFGGNPLNGTYLLNSAQAQNTFKPATPTTPTATPTSTASKTAATPATPATSTAQSNLDSFKTSLERTVLNKLSQDITNQLFPSTGTGSGSIQTGSYTVGDYVIDVNTASGGVNVTISDVIAGASTSIFIPQTSTK